MPFLFRSFHPILLLLSLAWVCDSLHSVCQHMTYFFRLMRGFFYVLFVIFLENLFFVIWSISEMTFKTLFPNLKRSKFYMRALAICDLFVLMNFFSFITQPIVETKPWSLKLKSGFLLCDSSNDDNLFEFFFWRKKGFIFRKSTQILLKTKHKFGKLKMNFHNKL